MPFTARRMAAPSWALLGEAIYFNAKGAVDDSNRRSEALAAVRHALSLAPHLATAIEINDRAAVDRLLQTITRAGASPEMVTSLEVQEANAYGDYSRSIQLLTAFPRDGQGHATGRLWDGWFDTLTALGYYDKLHEITGCPGWYRSLLSGEALPPTTYNGKPVAPEEFWTSIFFSAPASRAMVKLGHSQDLVKVYRAGFRDADDFITRTDRYGMLGQLAPNLAIALQNTGHQDEASYLLSATAMRLEQVLKPIPRGDETGRLAMVRAAQGNRGQALALLDSAIRLGWRPDGRSTSLDLAQEPAFSDLRGDPRFEADRKRILDHLAKERAELGPLKV